MAYRTVTAASRYLHDDLGGLVWRVPLHHNTINQPQQNREPVHRPRRIAMLYSPRIRFTRKSLRVSVAKRDSMAICDEADYLVLSHQFLTAFSICHTATSTVVHCGIHAFQLSEEPNVQG